MKDKHRRRKGRTWAEAAKMVLEKQPNTPMSCKEILRNIKEANLKDIRSGTVPSACLNAVLHNGCRGPEGTFYKVADMMGVYGLRSHLSDEALHRLDYKLDDSVDVLDETDSELSTHKQQSGTKKMPVCYLPEKAHQLIPSLRRFTLYHIPATSTSSSSSAPLPERSLAEAADDHVHHHYHRAKGLKASSQMHSPTRLKFTLHHKHQRRKQQIVPRIILKPLKSPPGKEPNYAAEVIDLTPSPSDNERDPQAVQDDDIDTDTSKDDNSENNLGSVANHVTDTHQMDNAHMNHQLNPSFDLPGLAGVPSVTSDNSGSAVDDRPNSTRSITRSGQGVRGEGSDAPAIPKPEPPAASRVSLRISMRQALPLQTQTRSQTMSKLMANMPGFSGKPRNREKKFPVLSKLHPPKKMSLHVDLETPDSILANVNLKALINKHTYNSLPAHYQYKLLTLLPKVDRIHTADNFIKMNSSALDNEFFARACSKWRERLSSGEFTPESQLRIRQEMEKDRIKLDPWKAKHFEPSWGQSLLATAPEIPESFASMGIIPPEERKAPAMHTRSSSQRKGVAVNSVSTVYRNTRSATSASHHHHYHKLGYESTPRHHRNLSSRESRRMQRMAQKEHKYRPSEVKSTPKPDVVSKEPDHRSIIADINIKQSATSSLPSQTNFSCSSLLSSMAMESQRNRAAASLSPSSSSSKVVQKPSGGRDAVSLKRPLEDRADVKEKRMCWDDGSVVVLDSQEGTRGQSVSTQSSTTVLTAVSYASSSRPQISSSAAAHLQDTKPKVLPNIKSPVSVAKQGHHTRTLAQIKAQTQARAQAHGQTRTLAQIKAQTTAKLLARSAAQADSQNQAKVPVHMPAILNRSRPSQWNAVKTVIPVALSSSTGSSSATPAAAKLVAKPKVQNHVVQVGVSTQQVVPTIPPFFIKTQPGSGVSVVYVSQPNVVTLVPASAAAIQQMNSKSPGLAKPVLAVQTKSSSKVVVESIPHIATSVLPASSASKVTQRPSSIKTLLSLQKASAVSQNSASPHEEKKTNSSDALPNGTSPETPNADVPAKTECKTNAQSAEPQVVISGGVVVVENPTKSAHQQSTPSCVAVTPAVTSESIKLVTNSSMQVDPFSCRPSPGIVLQRVDTTANGRESADSLDASPGKCSCRLGAMVICKGCGAFCHDDCISPASLCRACIVR